jgi:hypothetical protein
MILVSDPARFVFPRCFIQALMSLFECVLGVYIASIGESLVECLLLVLVALVKDL